MDIGTQVWSLLAAVLCEQHQSSICIYIYIQLLLIGLLGLKCKL